ncbi:MAG: hypothetical protein K2W95_25330 [Candidatus Obscuribacterales bacterium]|nr:hypothetical protein [Candidatus Obscuribacterales bacterium]
MRFSRHFLAAGIAAFALALGFTASASAEDRVAGFTYVEEKGHGLLETKRVTVTDKDGVLKSKVIHYRDGRVLRDVFRKDGTQESSHEVWGNGQQKEHIEYDATGRSMTSRKKWHFDGSLESEAVRKKDGHTLLKEYYPNGKLRKERELFDKNGFSDVTYRKDGTKWYGSERKSGETGRGTSLYFAPGGKSLRRSYNGTVMTVTVLDDKGVELYTQTWISGIARYQLSSVKESLAGGAWRVVNMRGKDVQSVDYYKADGTLEKTELPAALSTPVDASRLQELNSNDDPTIPILRQLR